MKGRWLSKLVTTKEEFNLHVPIHGKLSFPVTVPHRGLHVFKRKFAWIISDVAHLQERIDTLESQSHSSSAKELQLQAELSAAQSEVKQLQGALSDADMYNKRCQELQSKLNGRF